MAYWIPPEGGVGASGGSPPERPPEPKDDKDITEAVHTALFVDPNIDDKNYSIRTENGVVYISGVAKNEDERRRVRDIALGIDGVREVLDRVRVLEE